MTGNESPKRDLDIAHKHSAHHRSEILASETCGCFYCLAIFSPCQIVEWIDEKRTALCPECAVDSVIGSRSGYPITHDFLRRMYERWFEN
jgi:acetone carboxylase gamma subunit